eukprot:3487221-Rhodomonas_salina.3
MCIRDRPLCVAPAPASRAHPSACSSPGLCCPRPLRSLSLRLPHAEKHAQSVAERVCQDTRDLPTLGPQVAAGRTR